MAIGVAVTERMMHTYTAHRNQEPPEPGAGDRRPKRLEGLVECSVECWVKVAAPGCGEGMLLGFRKGPPLAGRTLYCRERDCSCSYCCPRKNAAHRADIEIEFGCVEGQGRRTQEARRLAQSAERSV